MCGGLAHWRAGVLVNGVDSISVVRDICHLSKYDFSISVSLPFIPLAVSALHNCDLQRARKGHRQYGRNAENCADIESAQKEDTSRCT